MKCAETTVLEQPDVAAPRQQQAETDKHLITLPEGLLGFERVKQYTLLGSAEEAPFLWLQMTDDPKLAFLVISPSMVLESYQPDISEEEVTFLDLDDPRQAMVFNIVTLHPDGRATVNLKGPIVLNRQTLIGKQIVPLNAAEFSLQHPVAIEAVA